MLYLNVKFLCFLSRGYQAWLQIQAEAVWIICTFSKIQQFPKDASWWKIFGNCKHSISCFHSRENMCFEQKFNKDENNHLCLPLFSNLFRRGKKFSYNCQLLPMQLSSKPTCHHWKTKFVFFYQFLSILRSFWGIYHFALSANRSKFDTFESALELMYIGNNTGPRTEP